ncbi:type II toxin-antitoxin system RelE/ParE family toxin [Candidatus Margulisiibacteriota bacterium]
MSNKFQIAETKLFSKKIHSMKFCHLYLKLTTYIYPQLKTNPFFGINIKKLKGSYNDYYRYRIADYRVFYKIDTQNVIVFLVDVDHRKNAY